MEPESSLPRLQEPATCPYPEPEQSNLCSPSHFLKIHLNIITPSMPESSKWSLSHRFPHQNPVHTSPLPHSATYLARLFLLVLITLTIFGTESLNLLIQDTFRFQTVKRSLFQTLTGCCVTEVDAAHPFDNRKGRSVLFHWREMELQYCTDPNPPKEPQIVGPNRSTYPDSLAASLVAAMPQDLKCVE